MHAPYLYGGDHRGASIPEPTYQQGGVDSQSLDQSIKEVLKRDQFSWRSPRQRQNNDDSDLPWPLSMISDLFETFNTWADSLNQFMRRLIQWVDELFRDDDRDDNAPPDSKQWMDSARIGMWVLAGLLVVIGAAVFWKTWRHRKETHVAQESDAPIEATPDLNDENVKADLLPSERWIDMAQTLLRQGALPQSLRAFYLATLAHLAENGFITIRKYKSDGDYINELSRRAHTQTDLLSTFKQQVGLFTRGWYGMYALTQEDIKKFTAMQKRIMYFVETV